MVNVFDNFVSYGGSFLATSDKHKHMLLDLYETAMTSEQLGATDRVSSCKLAGQTMLCLRGCLDDVRIPADYSFLELDRRAPNGMVLFPLVLCHFYSTLSATSCLRWRSSHARSTHRPRL